MAESEIEARLKQHLISEGHRLDRIENKIDKLSETVVALARAEQKLIALEEAKKDTEVEQAKMAKDLDSLYSKLRDTQNTFDTIKKLFWVVIAALAPLVLSSFNFFK